MKRISQVLMAMVLVFGCAGSVMAYTILDDSTGGECTHIGIWNSATKTCTLTMDLNMAGADSGIAIKSNNIVLDGNGYSLVGPGNIGIFVEGAGGYIIKNLNISNFVAAILSYNYCGAGTIMNNHIENSEIGILLTYNSDDTVIGNTLVNNYYGIRAEATGRSVYAQNNISGGYIGLGFIYGSSYNSIADNVISAEYSLLLVNSHYNEIKRNTIGSIYMEAATNSTLYQNNFLFSPSGIFIEPSSSPGNIFSLEPPFGGNYWAMYDTPVEGCADGNTDGFCDIPLVILVGIAEDYFPWVAKDGWLSPTAQTAMAIEETQTDIQNYISSGDLSETTATSLSTVLDSALTAQESGNVQAADNILEGFIHQVEGQARAGKITDDAAVKLIESARQIITGN